jgi:hypothetical protein
MMKRTGLADLFPALDQSLVQRIELVCIFRQGFALD